jgi:DNA-binding GntR family transcriptional regulator
MAPHLTAQRPPQNESTSARLAESISKRILRRQFVVGQRLVEADLMSEFEVSRSTVREALKMLATSGIVELSHNRGAVVRTLSAKEAQDLLQVLELLTGLAARLAAEKIGQGDNRERFEAVAKPLSNTELTDDLSQVLDQRARYYQVMLDIAGSPELARVMPVSRAHLFRTQFYTSLTKSDVKVMVAEYRSITQAILAGDPAKAEARMRRHIQKSAERSLPHYLA